MNLFVLCVQLCVSLTLLQAGPSTQPSRAVPLGTSIETLQSLRRLEDSWALCLETMRRQADQELLASIAKLQNDPHPLAQLLVRDARTFLELDAPTNSEQETILLKFVTHWLAIHWAEDVAQGNTQRLDDRTVLDTLFGVFPDSPDPAFADLRTRREFLKTGVQIDSDSMALLVADVAEYLRQPGQRPSEWMDWSTGIAIGAVLLILLIVLLPRRRSIL